MRCGIPVPNLLFYKYRDSTVCCPAQNSFCYVHMRVMYSTKTRQEMGAACRIGDSDRIDNLLKPSLLLSWSPATLESRKGPRVVRSLFTPWVKHTYLFILILKVILGRTGKQIYN